MLKNKPKSMIYFVPFKYYLEVVIGSNNIIISILPAGKILSDTGCRREPLAGK
jgi:hypothetical protein